MQRRRLNRSSTLKEALRNDRLRANPQKRLDHFFEQFAGPMQASWNTLGNPELTPEVQKKPIDGVHAEAGSRTIAELEAERDELLLGLLELRSKSTELRAAA